MVEGMKVMGVRICRKFDLGARGLDEELLLGREIGVWRKPLFVDEMVSKILGVAKIRIFISFALVVACWGQPGKAYFIALKLLKHLLFLVVL